VNPFFRAGREGLKRTEKALCFKMYFASFRLVINKLERLFPAFTVNHCDGPFMGLALFA